MSRLAICIGSPRASRGGPGKGTFVARGEEVLGTLVVTETMVGAPGRLHGGVMMAFIDEALGLACLNLGAETMTASLTVDLRAPVFVGAVLSQRAGSNGGTVASGSRAARSTKASVWSPRPRGLWIEPRPA